MEVEIGGLVESPDDLPVAVLNSLKLATLWFPSMVEDVLSECFIQM